MNHSDFHDIVCNAWMEVIFAQSVSCYGIFIFMATKVWKQLCPFEGVRAIENENIENLNMHNVSMETLESLLLIYVFLFSWLKLPFCLNLHAKLEIEMTNRAEKEYYKYILFHGCQYEKNKGIHRWIERINKDRNYNALKISFK